MTWSHQLWQKKIILHLIIARRRTSWIYYVHYQIVIYMWDPIHKHKAKHIKHESGYKVFFVIIFWDIWATNINHHHPCCKIKTLSKEVIEVIMETSLVGVINFVDKRKDTNYIYTQGQKNWVMAVTYIDDIDQHSTSL